MKHVEMRLVDPEAMVHVAEAFMKGKVIQEVEWLKRKRFLVFVSSEGVLGCARYKKSINKAQGAYLGDLGWREKQKLVTVRGSLLLDMEDEIREAFEQVGLRTVFIRSKK